MNVNSFDIYCFDRSGIKVLNLRNINCLIDRLEEFFEEYWTVQINYQIPNYKQLLPKHIYHEERCGICKFPFSKTLKPPYYIHGCGHVFCKECLDRQFSIVENCPQCNLKSFLDPRTKLYYSPLPKS